ncbi:MAG: hypothetical protein QM658_04825 [Gordonia sp. (in: high G+C Gram-positive bacteria)]
MEIERGPALVCRVGRGEWIVDDGSRSVWNVADLQSELRQARGQVRTLSSQLAHRWGGGDFYNGGPNSDTPPALSRACLTELSNIDWVSRSVRIVADEAAVLWEVPSGRSVALAESAGDVVACAYGRAEALRRPKHSLGENDRRIFAWLGRRFVQVPTPAGNVVVRMVAEGESDGDAISDAAAIASAVNDDEDISEWMHLWDTEGPLRSDSDPRRKWTESGGVFRAAVQVDSGDIASVRTGLPVRWTSEDWC